MKVILVQSIKGGCGKSLVAINIAEELSKKYRVGLIDADVDSPNIPGMIGMNKKMEQGPDKRFIPKEWTLKDHKPIKLVSPGLLDDGQITLFKTGEETRQILYDLIMRTEWGDVDYMIVDLPAGSGDEFRAVLSVLAQYIMGVILVTLPTTLEDCSRVVDLCTRNGIRIIGMIDNQDGTLTTCGCKAICPECGEEFNPYCSHIGDAPTAEKVSATFELRFLGKIPLTEGFYAKVLSGMPILPDAARGAIEEAVRVIITGTEGSE